MCDVMRQEFQRNFAFEARVFGDVDDAHATAAEFFEDRVVRDGAANKRRGVRQRCTTQHNRQREKIRIDGRRQVAKRSRHHAMVMDEWSCVNAV